MIGYVLGFACSVGACVAPGTDVVLPDVRFEAPIDAQAKTACERYLNRWAFANRAVLFKLPADVTVRCVPG